MDIKERVINDSIIKDIRDAAGGLTNGTILIIVRDRKITQIEVSHRTRFDEIWEIEDGGGI